MFGNVKLILGTGVVIIALILCLAFLLNKTLNKNKKSSETEDSELIYMKDSDFASNKEMDSSLSGNNQPSKPNESNPSESESPIENSDENYDEDLEEASENDTDALDSSEDTDDDPSPIKVTKNLTIYSGNTDRIKINSTEGKPENIIYTPEDTSIAEVINGHVVAKQEGITNVTTSFSLNGENMSFLTSVTVLSGRVSVTSSEVTVMEGTSKKIKTKVNKGVLSGVTYASDNPEVATVVNDGVDGIITGVSQGTASITVTADVSGTITVKEVSVTVSAFNAESLPIDNPVNAENFTEEDDWQGSRVYFGVFEQDNKTSNGKEPILWRVLEVNEDSALLLSEYGLICKNINETFDDFTWETCSLRNWLNTSFLDIAFTNLERRAILDNNIATPDSNYWGTKGGNDTIDKVFLPTMQDVMNPAYGFQKGMKPSKTRMLKCTIYARKNGGYKNKTNGNTCWWLRSPALHEKYAAYVFTTGAITATYFVGRRYDAIRPAIRVDLSAIQMKQPAETGENIYPYINVKEY
ncbi:DUF6273 domain-containing protein [Anaerocolumna sp.]|uniref:DUF6273 domain-containing protein n=1 Tax=Anaerocolumna sp. TaxID=2041569 RepID=UPI0028B1B394|nr:DUF6273 domain-containing protein [Anaerocolumna sp.]